MVRNMPPSVFRCEKIAAAKIVKSALFRSSNNVKPSLPDKGSNAVTVNYVYHNITG